MKKKVIILATCILTFTNFAIAQSLTQIIEELSKEIGSQDANKMSIKNIVTKTLTVNSSSNARLYNSNTREVVKLEIPAGTKNWFYRITVLDVDKNYSYQSNETLHHLLSNNKTMNTYAPTNEGVDFYIFDHSGEVESFKRTGNDNFTAYTPYTKLRTNTFAGDCKLTQENLWIGIKNPNSFVGLKVIVEVVAWGDYN